MFGSVVQPNILKYSKHLSGKFLQHLLMTFVITSHLRPTPQCVLLIEPSSVLHTLYTFFFIWLHNINGQSKADKQRKKYDHIHHTDITLIASHWRRKLNHTPISMLHLSGSERHLVVQPMLMNCCCYGFTLKCSVIAVI